MRNIHLYPSPIVHESRIFKESAMLARLGKFSRILLVGTWERGLKKVERLSDHRVIVRIELRAPEIKPRIIGRIIRILEWSLRVVVLLRKKHPRMINAHNLASLPAALCASFWKSILVIYSTHELESQRSGWNFMVRQAARLFEITLMPGVDRTYVVSDSIRDWYQLRHPHAKIHVIKNLPLPAKGGDPTDRTPLRQRFSIPPEATLFIYQGLIDRGRFVEALLEAFASMDGSKHIVFLGFVGPGYAKNPVLPYAEKFPNIHFHPSVPPSEVHYLSMQADIGLYLIEPVSLSYKLTVGNKVYEYLNAGIPVLASDFPDIRRLISDTGAGWTVAPDSDSIARSLRDIDSKTAAKAKSQAKNCAGNYSWDKQEPDLLRGYAQLLDEASPR